MESEVRFQLEIGKLQLTSEDHAFLWFYIGSSKQIIFFRKTSLKLAQRREPFDNIMFVNDSSVINKISFFDLTTCSQNGRGEVGMFILSIHCMKKGLTSTNMILCEGKNPWKVNLNGILNDWDRISVKLQNFHLKIKVYFSF